MTDSILDKVLLSKHAAEISHFSPHDILTKLFVILPERERDILARRFSLQGKKVATLEEIGKNLEVTRERVRQIERSAIQKIKASKDFAKQSAVIENVIRQYLEDAGGALSENELFARLLTGRDRMQETRAAFIFLLHELLAHRFFRIVESDTLRAGWALAFFSKDLLQKTINLFIAILQKEGSPMPLSALFLRYHETTGDDTTSDNFLEAVLSLTTVIAQNAFGEWGLVAWPLIRPRRMTDKIYLVLQQYGKPLHFTGITEKINAAKFDQKVAHAPTVHNELIMDKRYVLVGRGTYALAAWGYKPGIVADVITTLLREQGPMSRDALVTAVLTQRVVGKTTVHLALTNHDRFTKLPDGKYTIVTQQ